MSASNATPSTPAPAVPLPRNNNQSTRSSKPPVWPIDSTAGDETAPLVAKCARHSRADGVCCKDLRGDDERTLIDPDVVRDVYGLPSSVPLCTLTTRRLQYHWSFGRSHCSVCPYCWTILAWRIETCCPRRSCRAHRRCNLYGDWRLPRVAS